LNDGDKIV
jgi:hypothetical protein